MATCFAVGRETRGQAQGVVCKAEAPERTATAAPRRH